ncbi:MAG: SMC-Scp complex subunit ScpB [Pseudomonadales bacterium]|nr:SMC-Scp complex subunit ScpB [Pseudomonadales bacterium]MBO6596039.1 SMC-Scp complex subunit ScpB [Pseudomonadales bacterium]MBO6822522.1 SMC-Scp complex subunit ScpB [Pseudomonadales bacterium]
MEGLPIKQIVEGAIMAAEAPLSVDQLMQLFEDDGPARSDLREVLKEIEQDCEGRGYELKQVASGYRFQVRSDYGEWVARLWKEKPPRYSRALLETLALVAYKQPITRGDIEEIRGVAVSTNIMRTLVEREWVRIVGHRDVPGQPALYATTKEFLDYFNLRSLDELPTLAEIKDMTKVNEELTMEEELIEVRTLEVDAEEQEAVAGLDDTDLDAVSEQVENIQQNIKNLFAPDEVEEDPEGLEEDERETALSEKTALSEETALSEKTAVSEETALSEKTAVSEQQEEPPAAEPAPAVEEESATEESDASEDPERRA